MARYAVRIHGSNGSTAFATAGAVEVYASTAGRLSALLCVRATDSALPALFGSREEARAAGLAAHWNNQSFEVIVARGAVRATGSLIEAAGPWHSCQGQGL